MTNSPPSLLYGMAELPRVLLELTMLFMAPPAYEAGDGHTVVVMPGFMCGEHSTVLLRQFLTKAGYEVYDWGLGVNMGSVTIGHDGAILDGVLNSYASDDKITIIGHSLGGVMAVDYAARYHENVRQVICLGSPTNHDGVSLSTRKLYTAITGESPPVKVLTAPKVPITSIFSNSDGIVAPQSCHDSFFRNVEVHSSHFGLVINRSVLEIVADTLCIHSKERIYA